MLDYFLLRRAFKQALTEVSARPQWWDRTPKHRILTFDGTVGPHVSTSRDSYTVPDGRKAFIQYCFMHIIRTTAATVAAAAIIDLNAVINAENKLIERVIHVDKTLASFVISRTPMTFLMMPRDKIAIHTLDANADGDCEYFARIIYTEFDY